MKINISFITSNDFRRLCPFCFVLPTSKHNYRFFKILILVQSFSACTFSRIYSWLFSRQTFINLVTHSPFKWPRQGAKNSSKRKRHSQQQFSCGEPKPWSYLITNCGNNKTKCLKTVKLIQSCYQGRNYALQQKDSHYL